MLNLTSETLEAARIVAQRGAGRAAADCRRCRLQLSWPDRDAESAHASDEALIERYEAALEQLRERDVFGVVGLGPSELVGDLPGDLDETGGLSDLDRGFQDSGEHRSRSVRSKLPSPCHLVQNRGGLDAHELRCNQLVSRKAREAERRMARGDRDGRVEDQQHGSAAAA